VYKLIQMKKNTLDEINYILNNHDVLNYSKLFSFVREKKFTLKEVGVTYRWITHWHSKGLLIRNYEESKWRKFDLIEYVWLRMIIQMRKFNISLEMIKRIKENLIQEIPVSEALDNKEIIDLVIKLAKEDKRTEIENVLKSGNVLENMKDQSINLFETLIMDIISFHNSFSIFISSKDVVPIKHSSLEFLSSTSSFNNILTGSFISISMSEILRDFMLGEHGIKQKQKLALLSDSEEQVLNTLREDNLKSVMVRYGTNQQIDILETVRVETVDKRARLMDFIMSNGYQDITIKTQNGEIVYCENKRKTLINKSE